MLTPATSASCVADLRVKWGVQSPQRQRGTKPVPPVVLLPEMVTAKRKENLAEN